MVDPIDDPGHTTPALPAHSQMAAWWRRRPPTVLAGGLVGRRRVGFGAEARRHVVRGWHEESPAGCGVAGSRTSLGWGMSRLRDL